MKVAIVGAGGLVGTEFMRQLSTRHDVLPFTHRDLDITDSEAVTNTILDERPALVINCAVLGVDACERSPQLASSVNVSGAEVLAKATAAVDAEFVQFSSNYVFDGKRTGDSFYTSRDVPAPINVYGRTKVAGERAVRAAVQRCIIVRTSWVFGAGKKNFFSTIPRSLNAGKKIRAITDVWASCTYVCDLVKRVMEILSLRRYATYHVVNSGLCSYHEFALEVAHVLGIPETTQLIEPIKLCDLRLHAERPHYTPLYCETSEEIGLAPLRDWRVAVTEYVRDFGLHQER